MTNLDNILKSRDITLQTKVSLVKAMVFPVIMYGYDTWAIKKAEHWRTDAFELWCWRKLLRVPCSPRDSQESSPALQFKGMNFLVLCLLYGPALTTVHDHWEDPYHEVMGLDAMFLVCLIFNLKPTLSLSSFTSPRGSLVPASIQVWFPLILSGLIPLLSKGPLGVFSSTTVQRHQFFGILPFLWPSSHNCTWPLGRP